jgi:hypothetical protein
VHLSPLLCLQITLTPGLLTDLTPISHPDPFHRLSSHCYLSPTNYFDRSFSPSFLHSYFSSTESTQISICYQRYYGSFTAHITVYQSTSLLRTLGFFFCGFFFCGILRECQSMITNLNQSISLGANIILVHVLIKVINTHRFSIQILEE